jgi:hypothetical protein
MSELVAAFISELIRAANEVQRPTTPERARLLKRAAGTIRITVSRSAASLRTDGNIVEDLTDTIVLHAPKEVAAMMLDAVATIKTGRSDVERRVRGSDRRAEQPRQHQIMLTFPARERG